MLVNKGCVSLPGPHETSLLAKLSSVPIQEREDSSEKFYKIMTEPTFRNIVDNIFAIQDEPTSLDHRGIRRQAVLESIERFTTSAMQFDSVSGQVFDPVLNFNNRKQLVNIRFSGLGGEIDRPHPAIVWEQENNRDRLLIIPVTSFKENKTKEKPVLFDIGQVDFLSKRTVVKLDQITLASRKKLLDNGIVEDDITGMRGNAYLSASQVSRIREGMLILFQGKKSLFQGEIEFVHKDRLPEFQDPVLQFNHLNRPYRIVNITKERVDYQLINDSNTTYTLYRRRTSRRVTEGERKRLLRDWLYAVASADIHGNITITRDASRIAAYQRIQQFILPQVSSTGINL